MATSRKKMTPEEWELLENIGQMFKDLRKQASLTQQEAAYMMNRASQSRIPVLEHGGADIMITTLSRWAKIYGYEVQIQLVPVKEKENVR